MFPYRIQKESSEGQCMNVVGFSTLQNVHVCLGVFVGLEIVAVYGLLLMYGFVYAYDHKIINE